jgi:hypothetical protein
VLSHVISASAIIGPGDMPADVPELLPLRESGEA